MNVEVQDYTVNGRCAGCGMCCSNLLPLSDDEIERIKKYIKAKDIKEQRHNGLDGIDMTCPFRDERNKKCLIYDIRPDICKSFLCNREVSDLEEEKRLIHRRNKITVMRKEFFGSSEDDLLFGAFMRAVAECTMPGRRKNDR